MPFYRDRVVPRLIDHVMRARDLAAYRSRALANARGRVLEVGFASGQNLPHYGPHVAHVVGLDPSAWLLGRVRKRPDVPAPPVDLVRASAERIPLESASVDTVVSTWTLCSVPDLDGALSEIRRVLAPGGRFVFVEHGLADDERIRRWQRRLTPVWRRIGGGCHLDRPIAACIEHAGFRIDALDTGVMRGSGIATFMYEGVATPR
jgi:ubiquinone/menaquinone biosynthesis C-methylase UbiE